MSERSYARFLCSKKLSGCNKPAANTNGMKYNANGRSIITPEKLELSLINTGEHYCSGD